jgi:hypothetical protein
MTGPDSQNNGVGPVRIRLSSAKGWRKPEGTIVVARGRWGNPYRPIKGTVYGPARPIEGGELHVYSTHSSEGAAVLAAVDYYRRDVDCAIRSRLTTEDIRRCLAGKNLACWCRPDRACHADILLELANNPAVTP